MARGSKIFKKSLREVFNASIRALQDSGFKINEQTDNTIKATTSISLFSWGENIEIVITYKKTGTEVIITSEAQQLFDWGKSEENISLLFSRLEQHLK